jgi:hypothetical protein
MEVTKEALEKYTQAARKAYCSMPKFNDDRWQSATRAVLALVPEPSASDLERIQSSYSSGSQSGAQDQTTAAAPQTDEDAELVEELCEAQFKKGAATNIRSVLSRLGPDKEHTSLHDACQVLENARKQAGKEHL